MKFGPVPIAEAEGAILAHSELVGGRKLRKGRKLEAADITAMAGAGLTEVTVARLEPGDVHEDAAATRLAQAILGKNPAALGLRASRAATGRVNLYSDLRGVAEIDPARVDALNAVDPMITLATVPRWQFMGPGGMVATVKIISYAVPEAALARAEAVAGGAMRMRPVVHGSARLIQTAVDTDDAAKGHKAIHSRLEALGIPMGEKTVVPHQEDAIAAALAASAEDMLLILTGSATSDLHDTAPEAVRRAGGRVIHFGMPVDPGNLLFLGELAGRPVIGLPGCARSPARNGADWVLERVACGVDVTGADIAAMGVGGLLKEIPSRPQPRERPAKA